MAEDIGIKIVPDIEPSPRKAQAKKPTPEVEARKPASKMPSVAEMKDANAQQFAAMFGTLNDFIAETQHDDYFRTSSVENSMVGQAVSDSIEWAGVEAVPPPITLLCLTLSIYIPRGFHYYVHKSEREMAAMERMASENGHVEDEVPVPEWKD